MAIKVALLKLIYVISANGLLRLLRLWLTINTWYKLAQFSHFRLRPDGCPKINVCSRDVWSSSLNISKIWGWSKYKICKTHSLKINYVTWDIALITITMGQKDLFIKRWWFFVLINAKANGNGDTQVFFCSFHSNMMYLKRYYHW